MKKLLLIIPILLMICNISSCNTSKSITEDYTYSINVSNVSTLSIDTFTITQIDSMVNVDKLPDYNKWVTTYLKDGSTNVAYQYSTLYDPETGIIYTIKQLRDGTQKYIVMKRLTISDN